MFWSIADWFKEMFYPDSYSLEIPNKMSGTDVLIEREGKVYSHTNQCALFSFLHQNSSCGNHSKYHITQENW